MPNMVVVVMSDVQKCQDVLDAWEQFGVTGVTILESLGCTRFNRHASGATICRSSVVAPFAGRRRIPSPDCFCCAGRRL